MTKNGPNAFLDFVKKKETVEMRLSFTDFVLMRRPLPSNR
jgi:hypothetical protein